MKDEKRFSYSFFKHYGMTIPAIFMLVVSMLTYNIFLNATFKEDKDIILFWITAFVGSVSLLLFVLKNTFTKVSILNDQLIISKVLPRRVQRFDLKQLVDIKEIDHVRPIFAKNPGAILLKFRNETEVSIFWTLKEFESFHTLVKKYIL